MLFIPNFCRLDILNFVSSLMTALGWLGPQSTPRRWYFPNAVGIKNAVGANSRLLESSRRSVFMTEECRDMTDIHLRFYGLAGLQTFEIVFEYVFVFGGILSAQKREKKLP